MPKKRQDSKKQPKNSEQETSGRHWYQRPRNLIIIAVLVVLVAATGWSVYNFKIRPYNQTVINYNGKSFSMRYFLDSLSAYYGKAPADNAVADFPDWVEQQIEQNQNIIQGSAALGVQIPRSNIVSELSKNGEPTNQASVDILMAQKLLAKQVPSSQPQYNIQAMLLESESRAQMAVDKLKAGETFADVSGNYSRFSSTAENAAALGWVTARQAEMAVVSNKFADIVTKAAIGAVNGPVYDDTVTKNFGYWVARIVEKKYVSDNGTASDNINSSDNTTTLEVHYQGILLASSKEAEDVMAKLNGGADLNELAKQVSLMPDAKDNGAELGWQIRATDTSLFDALVDLPLNTVTGPIGDDLVATPGGYWVFNILEKKDNQELSDYQQNLLTTDLTDRCTAALKANPDYKVENLLTQDLKDFALNKVVLAQGAGSVLIGITMLPDGQSGTNYYCALKAYGEQKGNAWTITSGELPQGLTLDGAKGVISGIPSFAGGGGFTIKVENNIHFSTQELVYRIRVPVSVTTESLLAGKVGEGYDEMLVALTDADYATWSITDGKLPDGLTLENSTGIISGTPTAAGTFSFTAQADDGMGKATKALTITIE